MQLPLFPLNTVLFPGGVLPLRVFEARYMDMVRQCMKTESFFGVVLITRGGEVGAPAATESVGTLARIAAWDMPKLGLLHLRAVGGDRFRIEHTEVQPDGLQVATVTRIAADDDLPLPRQHQPCADLLQRILDDVGRHRQENNGEAFHGEALRHDLRDDAIVFLQVDGGVELGQIFMLCDRQVDAHASSP